MPAPHHSVFYRPDALPATQPTVLKHLSGKPGDVREFDSRHGNVKQYCPVLV